MIKYFTPHTDPTIGMANLLNKIPNQARDWVRRIAERSSQVTMGILKSLYPRANIDAAGDGWAQDVTQDQAGALADSSQSAAERVTRMLDLFPESV